MPKMPKVKRRKKKWFYMSDSMGRTKLVGLLPAPAKRKKAVRRKRKK